MPSIFHTNTTALNEPVRFPPGSLVVDTRFRRQVKPWSAEAVEALFAPGLYLLAMGLGSQACTNGDFEATPFVVAYRKGLAALQAVLTPGQDIVILCHCPAQVGRSHRRAVARSLARDLAYTAAGPLP